MLPVEYQLKNKELVKLWVEALRSGRYQQVQYKLREKPEDGGGHCCLGVLCEVAKPMLSLEGTKELEDYLDNRGYPPKEILKLLGQNIEIEDAKYQYISVQMKDGGFIPAHSLNDSYNMTFDQIADLLEQTHLKGDDNTSCNTEQVNV